MNYRFALLKSKSELLADVELVRSCLDQLQLPQGLCHGDFHPRNVMYDVDTGLSVRGVPCFIIVNICNMYTTLKSDRGEIKMNDF